MSWINRPDRNARQNFKEVATFPSAITGVAVFHRAGQERLVVTTTNKIFIESEDHSFYELKTDYVLIRKD